MSAVGFLRNSLALYQLYDYFTRTTSAADILALEHVLLCHAQDNRAYCDIPHTPSLARGRRIGQEGATFDCGSANYHHHVHLNKFYLCTPKDSVQLLATINLQSGALKHPSAGCLWGGCQVLSVLLFSRHACEGPA